MDFFTKFLKIFNSAARSWQIALAIVLGMMIGMTPASGLQTWVLLLIAFIINVPLGLMFFMAAQFALIGYLLDPMMEAFGYALLTHSDLTPFWTTLYNSSLVRLSYFDNTIILGSTLMSWMLALPLFFLLKFLLDKYREPIKNFFGKFRFLSWLGLFKEPTKKQKPIRIWGAGLFVILVGGGLAFGYLFADTLFKMGIEKSASATLGKEVYVDEVNVGFATGSLTIKGLEIADRGAQKSTVFIDTMQADIDLDALLLMRTHIENLEASGITFEKALTQAFLAARKTQAAEVAAQAQATPAPTATSSQPANEAQSMALPDVSEVLAKADLNTTKAYESAKVQIETVGAQWQKVINEEFGPSYKADYDAQLASIKEAANIKDIAQLPVLQQKVDTLKVKIEHDKNRIDALQKAFESDKKSIESAIKNVEKAKDNDFAALKSQYSFDKEGAFNVIGGVFGKDIQGYVTKADAYYAMAAPYLASDDEEEEEIVRHAGRWITFPEEMPQAKFWIVKSEISGAWGAQAFSGVIRDITDDQKLINKPTTFAIKSDTPAVQGLEFLGTLEHRTHPSIDSFVFNIHAIPEISLDLALVKAPKSTLRVASNIAISNGQTLDAKAQLLYDQTTLTLQGLEGRFAQAMQGELAKTQSFTIDVSAAGTLHAPQLALSTSLESIFKKAFENVMAQEIKRFEVELNKALEKMLTDALGGLGSDNAKLIDVNKLLKGEAGALDGIQKEADAKLKEAQKRIDDAIAAEKKKLQDALNEEKRKAQELADAKAKEADAKAKDAAQKAQESLKKAVPTDLGKSLKF